MLQNVIRFIFLSALIAGGSYVLFRYEQGRSAEALRQQELERLEEQKRQLQQFVSRLTAERRMADVLVIDQVMRGSEVESTTLMFVEYARDGSRLPPKFFTIKGKIAHIDALVIKFEEKFLEFDDALRGHSLILFYRIFDEYRSPSEGFRIDEPGRSPEFYRPEPGQPPAVHGFEAELWQNFWRLMDDPQYRAEKGVRLVQGEGLWRHFYPDEIYTVTQSTAGGLSIMARPIDGIWRDYRDALKRQRPNAE